MDHKLLKLRQIYILGMKFGLWGDGKEMEHSSACGFLMLLV
jgi:hypothetical protein